MRVRMGVVVVWTNGGARGRKAGAMIVACDEFAKFKLQLVDSDMADSLRTHQHFHSKAVQKWGGTVTSEGW